MEMKNLSISKIQSNPYNPRTQKDKEKLENLVISIKSEGVLSPIQVNKKGNLYVLIDGDRRLTAAKKAGLKEIPALIKEIDKKQSRVESLILNAQREDLSFMDKAEAVWAVFKEAGFKPQEAISKVEAIVRGRNVAAASTIIDKLGFSAKHIYTLLQASTQLNTEQKNLVRNKVYDSDVAAQSVSLPKEDRTAYIKKVVKDDLNRSEARELAKVMKTAPTPIKEAVMAGDIDPDAASFVAQIESPTLRKAALANAKREGMSKRAAELYVDTEKSVRKTVPHRKDPFEPINRGPQSYVNQYTALMQKVTKWTPTQTQAMIQIIPQLDQEQIVMLRDFIWIASNKMVAFHKALQEKIE